MATDKKHTIGDDLEFNWLTRTYGDEWETWRQYAELWIKGHERGLTHKIGALRALFVSYLITSYPHYSNVISFFKGMNGHVCSSLEFNEVLKKKINDPKSLATTNNHVYAFIDWVIENNFSEPNDNGVLMPLFKNHFNKTKQNQSLTETVRNPLPYRYIKDLRNILCPNSRGDFSDWKWAQRRDGLNGTGLVADWIEVDPSIIDKEDPDCVWCTRDVLRKSKGNGEKIVTVHMLWSPVRAMVAFIKLHLPLRTYQVRMLDSGEADTWRYKNGNWVENNHNTFALGSTKRQFARGVFKRIHDTYTGQFSTGLYINTNKTADQNKDTMERGYTIPWQNEDVLYWLEKLRNWQEKYNPINEPTKCSVLDTKHFGSLKSDSVKREMGSICFLFRDASIKGKDKIKPITATRVNRFWYPLLQKLEDQLEKNGHTLTNGERLKLVVDYPEGTADGKKIATLFPMHSMRVSLITAYAIDTELPLPVISKLLAGHSRLLLTIYYTKITPSVMADKMDEAELQLKDKEKESVHAFLKDASAEQIQCKMAYSDEDSIMSAIANRNPIGWENRSHGLCLVGGNTARSDEVSTLGGCWNGGEMIQQATAAQNRKRAPVPHGPENCVRCRWFISDASFLPALNAHFNQIGYKAHQAANLAVELESKLDVLLDEQYHAESEGLPFIKHNERQQIQRRLEKQLVESDEYTKDWIATFKLITRIMEIENQRDEGDTKDKLVAIGSDTDLNLSLKFIETDSELLHLSMLCEDAEFYPDLEDDLRKTPVIEKRSRNLNRILMKKDFEPVFMEMDDKQQLVAGNAMLRQMAKIADPSDKLEGYRKATNYLETAEYLSNSKLLDAGLNGLTQHVVGLDLFTNKKLSEVE